MLSQNLDFAAKYSFFINTSFTKKAMLSKVYHFKGTVRQELTGVESGTNR